MNRLIKITAVKTMSGTLKWHNWKITLTEMFIQTWILSGQIVFFYDVLMYQADFMIKVNRVIDQRTPCLGEGVVPVLPDIWQISLTSAAGPPTGAFAPSAVTGTPGGHNVSYPIGIIIFTHKGAQYINSKHKIQQMHAPI